MNIYEARWNNAVKIAEKINSFLDRGFLIFNGDDEIINKKFAISNDEIYLPLICNCNLGYFLKNTDYDEGMFTTIKEYNKQFKDWKFIHPNDIKRLF